MFKRNKNSKNFKTANVETILGANTVVDGNIHFEGGLHIDCKVNGNVTSSDDTNSVLILSEHGEINGDVTVPKVVVNGTVTGDVTASHHVELASNGRVNGNVYYAMFEMAMGATINGNMVHTPQSEKKLLEHHNEEADK